MTEPESGRCARCKENTVLERVLCETCNGTGQVESRYPGVVMDCDDCNGGDYTDLSPCCGVGLLDEAGAVDAASDRAQET